MAEIDLRIDDALEEAWDDLSAYVGRLFTQRIRSPEWAWPREPSPRDIVDTGNLAGSLRIERDRTRPLATKYQWMAPYTPHVHDGAVFRATDKDGNPRTLTARPFTRPVIRDRTRIQRYFALRFRLAMRNRSGGGPSAPPLPPGPPRLPAGGAA